MPQELTYLQNNSYPLYLIDLSIEGKVQHKRCNNSNARLDQAYHSGVGQLVENEDLEEL